jgi:PIN domain
MSQPRVYLETSFFRYLVAPPSVSDPKKADRQRFTRESWTNFRHKYELVVSQTVYQEFYDIGPNKITEQERQHRFSLLQEAGNLDLESGILELAEPLRKPRGPLPSHAVADTVHWAVAAAYGCEFVLTWNFKHLNNAAIKRSAERIFREYGYESPTLCSPEELEADLGRVDS